MRISDWSSDVGSSDLRAKQLVSRGFISQADIDSKTATRDAAVARVNVAKASLAETQARNGRLDIRAPAAGLVLTRDVEPGQIVSAGSGVLFRVALGGQMERSEEHTSELQSLMRISYAVFCLKKKNKKEVT